MTDLEYQKILQSLPSIVWFIGVVIIAIFTIILGFYMIRPSPQNPPITQKSNFAVVDTYKGRCDIVQWTDGSLATYKYFLDCNNK